MLPPARPCRLWPSEDEDDDDDIAWIWSLYPSLSGIGFFHNWIMFTGNGFSCKEECFHRFKKKIQGFYPNDDKIWG